jgi:undecaprenyl-diphosphatase
MLSFAFYGIVAFLIWRAHPRLWTGLITVLAWIALVIGIGVSRAYLGVHYPSDVVAGYVASASWLVLVILAAQVLRLYFARQGEDIHQPK